MQSIQATEVRNNFSSVIDTVVREKPLMVKRNRDYLMFLSQNQVLELVKECSFRAAYFDEGDGTTTATLEGFDLVVNAEDSKQATTALASELIDYAQEYFEQFQLHYNSPNRKRHFPYVLRVLLAQDLEEVKGLIHA